MSEWQPIETAPKDGRTVIYMTRRGELGLCHWSFGSNEDELDLWWDDASDDEACPRWWMPRDALPPTPPPSEGGA